MNLLIPPARAADFPVGIALRVADQDQQLARQRLLHALLGLLYE